MKEISKLRQRLSNVDRKAVEYKMTVNEARALLSEIDKLLAPAVVEDTLQEVKIPTVIYRVLDGGSL